MQFELNPNLDLAWGLVLRFNERDENTLQP